MQLKISIHYDTHWGENIYISGSTPELGAWDDDKAVAMTCLSVGVWCLDIDLNINESILEYRFLIKKGNEVYRCEWGEFHNLPHQLPIDKHHTFDVHDVWHDMPQQQYLYTSGFSDSFFRQSLPSAVIHYHTQSILLTVDCPYVKVGQRLVIVGQADGLGNWDINRALAFTPIACGRWQLAIDAWQLPQLSEYKLAICDDSQSAVLHWEIGGNRTLLPVVTDRAVHAQSIVYNHEPMYWKAAGVAIPVFSLRTNDSFGIGDFADLRKMVDWAVATGQKVIQTLPINDTTTTHSWRDSYPYKGISNYALHPLYLGLKDYPLRNAQLYAQYTEKAQQLNQLETVDYEKVLECKTSYLHTLYDEMGDETLNSNGFTNFYSQNEEWLFPYACFCLLTKTYNTPHIDEWETYHIYNKANLEKLIADNRSAQSAVLFVYFVQYLLHCQLCDVKVYAHRCGVILKGDIPIGINRNSVEAWIEPHLFNLDVQAGAPPDDFSANGQNWGFPTYNWDEMAKDGYAWWRKRFEKMGDYFDAYRIDHILGFFRIWEIPTTSVQGLLGYFSPALPLDVNEIKQAGLPFDEQRMTVAHISYENTVTLFSDCPDCPDCHRKVVAKYLHDAGNGRLELNDECDNQVKIQQLFAGCENVAERTIRDGLFAICNEVLFVADKKESHRFHPRIAAQHTFTYAALSKWEQEAFDRIYNDFFYHRHSQFWSDEAMTKLPTLIASTSMLICGEDLGMIPDCVPRVMHELQILSLEIERMPKQMGATFAHLAQLPYASVCTTSTHDMSPIRLWWNEDRNTTQRYYNEVLCKADPMPDQCTSDISLQILSNHLHSPAMLCILPLQDWLSISDKLKREDTSAERINVPSNPNHYWNYRMHLPLEDLIAASDLNRMVQQLITESGR